jgi:hypothetical protein
MLIHRNCKLKNSNFEVFKEMHIESEAVIERDKSPRSGYSKDDHKLNNLFGSNPGLSVLNDITPASNLLKKFASKKTARMILVDQSAACKSE